MDSIRTIKHDINDDSKITTELLSNLNIKDDIIPIVKEKIYILNHSLRCYESDLRREKRKFVNNKYILSFKYEILKKKINFVQISVITISTLMTLIETIKQYYKFMLFFDTVLPILLSSYIGVILSIARFYKFEDSKEALSKLDAKIAFIVNRIKYKLRFIESNTPIKPSSNFLEHLKEIEKTLHDFYNDGLEEVVTQAMQETDIIMNLKERLLYETKLTKLKLDSILIDKKIETLDGFKAHDQKVDPEVFNKLNINDYKKAIWFPFNYIYDLLFLSSSYNVKEDRFFNDVEVAGTVPVSVPVSVPVLAVHSIRADLEDDNILSHSINTNNSF